MKTDWATTPIEIEDLIPIPIARRAALNHIARFIDLTDVTGSAFSEQQIESAVQASGRMWEALETSIESVFPDEHIEKAGFAREVVKLLELNPDIDGAGELRERFAKLLGDLAQLLEDAADHEDNERASDQVARLINGFVQDHTSGIRKYDASRLLRQLELAIPSDSHSDSSRLAIGEIHREFELDDRSHPTVPRFDAFREAITALGQLDRLLFQDDTKVDPSEAVTPAATDETSAGDVGEAERRNSVDALTMKGPIKGE